MKGTMPEVGEAVIYHDRSGIAHNALVICVFSTGMINVVRVEPDAGREDSYGRQTCRETSVPHKSDTGVHGLYWRYRHEEKNPVAAPIKK